MKKITLLMASLFVSAMAFGQYYYLPANAGNPGNINTEDNSEFPGGGSATGWTSILGGGQTSPTWTSSQSIPFTFNLNGSPVTSYQASSTGVVTFASNPGTAPSFANTALPSTSIPDSSICVWGIDGGGASDEIVTKTFGTAPNRQHWIFYTSYTIPGNTASWTYWSVVLEETSNNIYVVDQRTGNDVTAITVGVQVNSTVYSQVAASPAVANLAGTDGTRADNWHYTFINGVQPAYDMSAQSAEVPNFLILNQAPFDVSAKFRNLGSATITSLDLNYSINGGAAVTSNLTGLNIGTYDSDSLSFGTVWTPAAVGVYTLKIWTSNLNSGNADLDNSNDTVTKVVNVVSNFAVRRPLYETFTSSTCPPCVPANTNMEMLFGLGGNYGEQSSIKYQMSWPGAGDPYFTLEGQDRRTYYSVSSVPNVAIDGGWNANGNGLTQGIMDQYKDIPAFVELDVRHIANSQTQTVNIDVNANFLNALSDPSITLHVALVENITFQNVGSNGEIEFHHVMKKMLPDASGTTIGAQAAGMQTWGFSYTFNGSYRLSNSAGDPIDHATEHSIENFDNLGVVAWIQNANTKEVYQSGSNMQTIGINENLGTVDFKVYPNPANDLLNIRFNENNSNVNLELINTLGQVVYSEIIDNTYSGESAELNISSIKPGIYIVKIAAEGKLTSKKLVIE